jgi:hypothetical protein
MTLMCPTPPGPLFSEYSKPVSATKWSSVASAAARVVAAQFLLLALGG